MILVYPLNMLKSCLTYEVFMNEIKKIYEWKQENQRSRSRGLVRIFRWRIPRKRSQSKRIPPIRPEMSWRLEEMISQSLFWCLDRYSMILELISGMKLEKELFSTIRSVLKVLIRLLMPIDIYLTNWGQKSIHFGTIIYNKQSGNNNCHNRSQQISKYSPH